MEVVTTSTSPLEDQPLKNAIRNGRLQESIRRFRCSFLQSGREKLFNVLPAQELARVMQEEVELWRDRLYAPLVVLRLFVEQVLHTDHACQDAVVSICQRAGGAGRGASELVHRAVLQRTPKVTVGSDGAAGQACGRAA